MAIFNSKLLVYQRVIPWNPQEISHSRTISSAQQHDGQLRSHEDDGGRRVFRDDGHGYLAPTWGGREGVGPRGNTYWD